MSTMQVIVAERGPLVWVFNFSPHTDYDGLQVRRESDGGCGDSAAVHNGCCCLDGLP
jgi:hypothetical protein